MASFLVKRGVLLSDWDAMSAEDRDAFTDLAAWLEVRSTPEEGA